MLLPQLRWNSLTANSPDSARVYRDTIWLLDQPPAALTEVSDTPLLSAWIAQPRLQQCAEGNPSRCSRSLIALVDIWKSDPLFLEPRCFRIERLAIGDNGATLGFPFFAVLTMRNPSEKFTSSTWRFANSLLLNPQDHKVSIKALSRRDLSFVFADMYISSVTVSWAKDFSLANGISFHHWKNSYSLFCAKTPKALSDCPIFRRVDEDDSPDNHTFAFAKVGSEQCLKYFVRWQAYICAVCSALPAIFQSATNSSMYSSNALSFEKRGSEGTVPNICDTWVVAKPLNNGSLDYLRGANKNRTCDLILIRDAL